MFLGLYTNDASNPWNPKPGTLLWGEKLITDVMPSQGHFVLNQTGSMLWNSKYGFIIDIGAANIQLTGDSIYWLAHTGVDYERLGNLYFSA